MRLIYNRKASKKARWRKAEARYMRRLIMEIRPYQQEVTNIMMECSQETLYSIEPYLTKPPTPVFGKNVRR